MKLNVSVGKVEFKVFFWCNGCRKFHPRDQFEINPKTGDTYSRCNACRAGRKSKSA